MKRVVVILLVFACSAFAEQPTAKQCRANLAEWRAKFNAMYADAACQGGGTPSCPFAVSVRQLKGTDLVHIPFEADACAKVDKKRGILYEKAATRAQNIVIMRLTYFLQHEDQVEWYANWEEKQLAETNPSRP